MDTHADTYRYANVYTVLTLSTRGGSLSMTMDRRNTNTGAVENRAVTSVGGIARRAREYM